MLTDRLMTVRDGWLTVDVTWDDVTGRLERIVATCASPNPIHLEIRRGGNPNPWREATLTNGQVYDESRPFGGGLTTLADIAGLACEVEY